MSYILLRAQSLVYDTAGGHERVLVSDDNRRLASKALREDIGDDGECAGGEHHAARIAGVV